MLEVLDRTGRIVFLHHDVLRGVVIRFGKGQTQVAFTPRGFDKAHRNIGAPFQQPGGHFAMTRWHHDFEPQAVVIGKLAGEFVFKAHQLAAIQKIGTGVVAQQDAQNTPLLDRVKIIEETSVTVFDHVLELQVAIDFAEQLRCVFADAPGDVALTGKIGRNAQIVAVTEVNLDQVTVEDCRINRAFGNQIEHFLGLYAVGNLLDANIRVALLLEPAQRMPEGRILVHHDRLAIQITDPLDRLVTAGNQHLLTNVIERHRKSHLL